MADPFYAHSEANEPPDRWQPVEDHLKNVTECDRAFANEFGAGFKTYSFDERRYANNAVRNSA